jgi:hypothetical protein
MAGYEIQPMLENDLREVALFLDRSMAAMIAETRTQVATNGGRQSGEAHDIPHHDLTGFLKNPHRRQDFPIGEIIRSSDGAVVGMILTIPWIYRRGDQRLTGLAAGNFFVDPSARMQGFMLFRRYLKVPDINFWYASSCNAQSGALWSKSGAAQVPNSDFEYMYFFRLGPLMEELALRKGAPQAAAAALKLAGPIATLVGAPRRPRVRLRHEPCRDFERLAELAERHRDRNLLTCERSAPYLNWLFGGQQPKPGERYRHEIFRFENGHGDEGWFVLARSRRGQREQIRNVNMLDVVWPREKIEFTDVLATILDEASHDSDMFSFRCRTALPALENFPGLRRRQLAAPEAFIISREPPATQLAPIADFAFVERI